MWIDNNIKANKPCDTIAKERGAEALRPFMQTLGIAPAIEGWEEGLTSEEFLLATKQMLRKKFNCHLWLNIFTRKIHGNLRIHNSLSDLQH